MGRKFLLVLVVLAVSFAFMEKQPKTYKNLSVAEFDAVVADAFLVDVHTPEQEHLAGTGAFIPYDQIGSRLNDLPADKNTEIILYCRSGSMSSQAAQVLVAKGYTNVKHLVGGIQAWREQHQAISLSPVSQDLGTVIYGEVAKTEFVLTNNTNQVVNLTRVSTSCSCTQAEAVESRLEPYTSTQIAVSFNPAVHQDDTDLGKITRTIFVDTDHQNFPKAETQITALVVKP